MSAYRWKWTALIKKETLSALQDLAASFGFVVTAPGGLTGRPSPADMLDALAACYRAAPDDTLAALAALLGAHGLLPSAPPDA